MDAQLWIYVIIIVIYFLSRLFKKGEQVVGESQETPRPERKTPGHAGQQSAGEPPRQLTFEELLREITEGKQAQRRQPQPEPVPEYETYEKDPGDEARSLENVDFDEAERAGKWKAYEEIPVRSAERRSLEETMRLEDTVVDFRKFDVFQNSDKKKVSDEYMKILRNPATLKQAVVLSEILKRKF